MPKTCGKRDRFLLDARSSADYAAGHIAGAFNLPVEDFDDHFPQIAPMLTPDTPIIAYCDGQECDLSRRLMVRLRELGYHNVRHLVNGWTAWHSAGSSPTREASREVDESGAAAHPWWNFPGFGYRQNLERTG